MSGKNFTQHRAYHKNGTYYAKNRAKILAKKREIERQEAVSTITALMLRMPQVLLDVTKDYEAALHMPSGPEKEKEKERICVMIHLMQVMADMKEHGKMPPQQEPVPTHQPGPVSEILARCRPLAVKADREYFEEHGNNGPSYEDCL